MREALCDLHFHFSLTETKLNNWAAKTKLKGHTDAHVVTSFAILQVDLLRQI